METEFVLSLGEQQWTLPAESDDITIGRASNADIRLQADDQISRIHARLSRTGTTWTLHDESRNGTGLNGRRITAPTPLSTNDRIHIGRSVLTFHKSTTPGPTRPPGATHDSETTAPGPESVPPAPPSAGAYGIAGAAAADSAAPGAAAYGASGPAAGGGAGSAAAGGAGSTAAGPPAAGSAAAGSAASGGAAAGSAAVGGAAAAAGAGAVAYGAGATAGSYGGEAPSPHANAAQSDAANSRPGLDRPGLDRPGNRPDPVRADAAYPSATGPADRAVAPPGDRAVAGPGDSGGTPPPVPRPPAESSAPPATQRPAPGQASPTNPAGQYARYGHPSPADAGPPSPFAPGNQPRYPDEPPYAGPDRPQHPQPDESPQAGPGRPQHPGGSGSYPGSNDSPFAGPQRPDGSGTSQPGGSGTPYPGSNDSPYAGTDRAQQPGGSGTSHPGGSGSSYAGSDDSPFAGPHRRGGSGTRYAGSGESPYAGTDRVQQPGGSGSSYAGSDESAYGGPQHLGGSGASYPNSGGTSYPQVGEAPYGESGGLGYGGGDPGGDGESAQVPGGGSWAAYPLADHLEHARSPWENAAGQIDQSESNWNESASWPDTSRSSPPDRRLPGDARTSKKRAGKLRTPPDRGTSDRAASDRFGAGEVEVGKVRLLRVLAVGGGLIAIGIVLNLIATFFADGPGGALRWLVPPVIALVAAMALAVRDAVDPRDRAPSRLDVSIVIGIAAVLLGVGVGGFALTAGAQYAGGYLSGNESGEDRLIKPIARTTSGLTVTVDNVTYTSHFTRVELTVANSGTESVKLPLDRSTTFTGAEGQALHADDGRSEWPGSIRTKGSEHGIILFKGRLPDAATTATLTLKSGNTIFTVPGILLTN